MELVRHNVRVGVTGGKWWEYGSYSLLVNP